jgi:TolB-like protein/Flp pilus assembly protein TadD
VSLITELKRRKVFKVGAAYLVVAWLAVQVVSIAFPAFEAPPWALRAFILVTMLGFPLALVMAWVFDVTPAGVEVAPGTQGTRWVVTGAVLLGMLALGWYFYGQPSFRKGDLETPVAARPDSLAVLPFANMSGDPKEDYFSDGMTEELLNVLAKVPRLQVVARTSVFEFKGKGGDVRAIGRKLGVSHIVQGSVRRDGEQVRITAQLVRVADGFQVWSQNYDRKLDSVFALQDEIAARIGEQLVTTLAPPANPARAAIDPEAYDEFLKGRALLRARKDLPTAIAHFKAATQKAPELAAAWSSQALACEAAFSYLKFTPGEEARMLACIADGAERAAALEPDSAASEHALGNAARTRFRYAAAERHYLRAMQIDPGYPDAREDYAELLLQVGRVRDSERAARQLVALDPYFIVGWNRLRDVAIALDSRADIEALTQRLRADWPNSRLGKFLPVEYALAYGRAEEARAALVQAGALWPEESKFVQVLLPWALGDGRVDEADVRAAIAQAPPGSAAPYLVARRDVAGYTTYIEGLGAPSLEYYFARLDRSRPAGHAMLRDPRVKAKLVEYGFVAYWRDKGWPASCRPLGDDDFECGIDAPTEKAP